MIMITNIRSRLKSWLEGCSRLVILGVGNPLRGDDSLGLEILKRLRGKLPRKVKVIYCGSSPENFVSKVRGFKPTHVLIIDAAHFGGKAGEARLILMEQISSITISTHTIPLNILAWLIQRSTNAKVLLLGIEPKNLGLGEKLSPEVREAIELCAEILIDAINETCQEPRALASKGNGK